ncbi:hypothetical protein GCM10011534_42810 [Pseudooceanicola nanhaiensis]|uniref:Uncharacterized protein n=2 Tax=Alphaproteobacteria TaxID=28211 RepID=A0A917TBL4_9RHOB|nr:hypothetical protein GCM10011534_42810 [Pseudooceanicola nanhaiensis]
MRRGRLCSTFAPAAQHRLSQLAPDLTARLFPVNASMMFAGAAVGPVVAGTIVDLAGIRMLGPSASAACLALALWMLWLRRIRPAAPS